MGFHEFCNRTYNYFVGGYDFNKGGFDHVVCFFESCFSVPSLNLMPLHNLLPLPLPLPFTVPCISLKMEKGLFLVG